MMRRIAILCGALLFAAAQSASATDLMETWRAAQQNDFEFVAAQAAREAGAARREQSASLWRPTLQFSGMAGRASNETATSGAQFSAPAFGRSEGVDFNTSIANGMATRWVLQARQPLLSRERDAQKHQLELSADVADLEWQAAQQALMLRTAERYFDVVLADESLRVLRRQLLSVERAAIEARDRFRLGDMPVTDTFEASARERAVKAQVLAAETQLELSRAALADLSGLSEIRLQTLVPAGVAGLQDPQPLAQWLADARLGNLQLRIQAAGIEVARQEAAKFSALAAPSLDLVAQLSRERMSGSGDFGASGNKLNNALVGVQLTVPLYTGGYRSAKQDEAQRLADKAVAEAGRAARQVAQQTRGAWLGLTVGAGRVAALDESSRATLARLDATRLGRQVGDRTTLDLLNAENDAASIELALLQARVSLLLDRLRLVALAGQLDEPQLRMVNAQLQVPAPR